MNVAKLKKLQYDEVAKCTRCGFCLPNCPTYAVKRTEAYTARGRNAVTRAVIEGRLELTEDLAKAVFSCLGCGACTVACFPAVKTKDAVMDDRALMTDHRLHPKIMDKLSEALNEYYNITEDDPEDREEWFELLKEIPEEAVNRETAETAYFVGCVASFFPMAQHIPVNMSTILHKAGEDFAVLGGEEWCCGFPLIGAGRPGEMEALKEHNLERIKAMGAKRVVFSCPSCYHTWKHFYDADVELMHASELLAEMVKSGRIEFNRFDLKTTYHDPCDLGRNSGVYEPPREVIKAIPGVELVEMANNRALANCCGGGGNVEMIDPDLSAAVAQMKLDEIAATGAKTVVSSCQQCLRTMATRAKRTQTDLEVMDLTQLVMKAMK